MNTTSHPPRPPAGRSGPPAGWTGPPPPQPHWAAMPAPPARSRASRLPSGAEALGWSGGIVTLIGIAAVTADYWTALRGWPLVAVLAVATAVLGAAAASVAALDGDHDDRLATQLATALGVMAGISTTWTAYVAVDQASDGRTYLAVLAAGSAASAMSAVVAQRTGRDVWWAATSLAGTVTAFAATALSTDDVVLRSAVVAAAGAVGLLLAVHLRPHATHLTQWLAATLMISGAEAALVLGPVPWAAAVIVAATAATALSTILAGRRAVGWTAAAGAAVLAVQVLNDVAPDLFSLSTAVLVAGIAMTVGCIVLVHRVRTGGQPGHDEDSRHRAPTR
jgi:hypothetical protein